MVWQCWHVLVVFCRFLPTTYQEYMPVLIDGDCEKDKENSNSWKKKTYRLSLAPWTVAWDRW